MSATLKAKDQITQTDKTKTKDRDDVNTSCCTAPPDEDPGPIKP
ncbi:MAG TPA: hypothetical protein VGG03_07825 [Thermoanaerobaculia bacterium]